MLAHTHSEAPVLPQLDSCQMSGQDQHRQSGFPGVFFSLHFSHDFYPCHRQAIFWIGVPGSATIILPAVRNWLQDVRVPAEMRGINWDLLQQVKLPPETCVRLYAYVRGPAQTML